MFSNQQISNRSRREFFTGAASGLGAIALASLLDATTPRPVQAGSSTSSLSAKPPHFAARAKNCIFVFLGGGTSQIELFDPKPHLALHAGQKLPPSFFENQRFSFIKADQSLVMPSRFAFRRYGQCGMELSELLPHIGARCDDITLLRSLYTDEFDHAPAEIFFSTGTNTPGRPSIGSWVTYGLGSETENLPGYVVLIAGRAPVARSSVWSSGPLPASTAGVMLRSQGEPVLNLSNPRGVTAQMQRSQLDAIRELNSQHLEQYGDREIQSRIEAYELAFRMQTAAPELIELDRETAATHASYGTDRPGESGSFSRSCLLARRLVERGTRFVSLFHRRWDHHSGLHHNLASNCRIVDQPLGALIHDLKQRGILDDTLVVWGTEFGRTPITENSALGVDAGRDHHRFGYSVWLAGGGVPAGKVIGATDEFGWNAIEDRVHVNDLHATLLHLFGLNHEQLTYRLKGLDVRLTNLAGHVVDKLIR